MNWIKFPTLVTALRSALPLCALLLVSFALADPRDLINEDGVLVIENDFTLDESLTELKGITIEEEGVLRLTPLTLVHMTPKSSGGSVNLKGTLIVPSTLGTGIYSSDEIWDGIDIDTFDPKPTVFNIKGGTIKIEKGDDSILFADTVHAKLEGDGTIDVDDEVTFISGTVSGTGNLTKIGGGTWQVDTVQMTGNFNVLEGTVDFLKGVAINGTLNVGALEKLEVLDEETNEVIVPWSPASTGTVSFLGNSNTTINIAVLNVNDGTVSFFGGAAVTIGTLNTHSGTSISGLQSDGTTKTDLTISGGGKIEGDLVDIGTLTLTSGTLTFADGTHDLEKLGIARNATLDIQDGVGIRLTSESAEDSYDDIIVEGTLKVSSGVLGIYKGDIGDLAPTYITVSGSVSTYADLIAGNITGGTVAIYKSDPDGPEFLWADTIDTRIAGVGKIDVAEGVTFQSGTIGVHSNSTLAHVVVSGGGTFKAHNVDIGGGYFVVIEETTMEFLEGVQAGTLHGGAGTQIFHRYGGAEEDFRIAALDKIELAGDYDGGGNDLKIANGGWLTGHIANVNEFTLGGTLLMQIDPASPMISTQSWTLLEPEKMQVRVFGTESGTYQKVIHVAENDSDADWQTLLGVLNNSETALYKPQWESNSDDSSYLDLELNILSVDRYISEVWGKSGQNVENVGSFIESFSMRNSAYREFLEGLSDAQLRSAIRSALAGELAGNAMRFAMQQPAYSVFRHLDGVAPLRSPYSRTALNRNTRGQVCDGVREGYNVWFSPFGLAEHAKREGHMFDGYDMSRYGFLLGTDIEIYNRAVAGVLFGYTFPTMKSDLGKISANDYTGALYFRMPTVWDVMLHMMLGFGNQDYTYKGSYVTSDFRGTSLFASVELSKPMPLSSFSLTPLVAMDFQSATMKEFIVYDPALGGVLIEPGNWDSAVFRVGLLGEAGRIRTRLQYMRQIAGEDFVDSRTSLTWDRSAVTTVRSIHWGKDWLNVGIGGELLSTKHWRVFADYDFNLGARTTSHIGSLNTVFRW